RSVAAYELHARTKRVALSTHQPQPDPIRARTDVVHEHTDRAVVVRDDDVGVAIVVEIAECRTAADVLVRERAASAIGDLLEAALAHIAKELTTLLEAEPLV